MRTSRWVASIAIAGSLGATAVATSLTATAAPAPTAPAATAQGQDRGTAVLRYDIRFRPQIENYVDIGTPGAGVGDLLVFQDQILDRQGRQVGVQGGNCTITALLPPDGFQTHCVGTVSLPAGQIAFQGLVTDAPEKRMAVVGGTGRYREAAGELTVLELGQNEAGTLTIRLR
jgi:hypothetical protein